MSQAGISNLAQTGGGGLIQTINGDTGSITGNTVTIYANRAANNSGASVFFTNSGTVSTLNLTDGFANTFLGQNCGGLPASLRAANVGVGVSCLPIITTGVQNTSAGYFSMAVCTTGNYNTCYGNGSGGSISSGANNIAIGYNCGAGSTGSDNVCIGGFNAGNLTSGNGNTILGASSGSLLTSSESQNILIKSAGSTGESNATRIGTQEALGLGINKCFIAGIVGVTASNAQLVTINSSTGQLGVAGGSVVGTWTEVTGATQTLAVGNGYVTNRGGGVTYTLPATAALGDVIKIVGKSGIPTITPNANQQIVIGSVNGTVGVTGTAVATNAGDCITLRCTTSGTSTVWRSESFVGNWTLL